MAINKQKAFHIIMFQKFVEIIVLIILTHFVKSLYFIEKVNFILDNSIIKADLIKTMYFTKMHY